MLRSRRRPRYGPPVCALISALLLLLSVSLLYTRLSLHDTVPSTQTHHFDYELDSPLLSDTDPDPTDSLDKIDELDTLVEDATDDLTQKADDETERETKPLSLYYVDHVTGSIRRALNKRSIEEWDYDYSATTPFLVTKDVDFKGGFGSDDVPIDEEVREKIGLVEGIEDALLLKVGARVSPLRDGWGDWFDKKGDFLRRDRMFKSNLEALDPPNNPMLQDPDGVGITGFTRGDKAVHKLLLEEIRKAPPFLAKKPLSVDKKNEIHLGVAKGLEVGFGEKDDNKLNEAVMGNGLLSRKLDNVVKRGEDTKLDDMARKFDVLRKGEGGKLDDQKIKEIDSSNGSFGSRTMESVVGKGEAQGLDNIKRKGTDGEKAVVSEELKHVYADGRRWGYFPGLDPRLSFSEFVRMFFKRGKCNTRVFMVWNSPPWMYGVRHQRGIESLLSISRNACVLVLSETIELDFFKDSFLKDGYKVAVAMPNLDELLNGTPTHVFATAWFQWRKTKFYPIHYSELVRLAILYKYGGIYLDSDIIVLNPLSSLNNTIGLEDQHDEISLNGAVMAFRKNSPFLKECLKEFFSTYDDTHSRWNGADLLTRVARNFTNNKNESIKQAELKIQPSYVFFPISLKDITRYFTTPVSEDERLKQDAIFEKIISESLTFHFWNSLTSTLIPEPESLAMRLLDHSCIRCHDML